MHALPIRSLLYGRGTFGVPFMWCSRNSTMISCWRYVWAFVTSAVAPILRRSVCDQECVRVSDVVTICSIEPVPGFQPHVADRERRKS